MNVHTEKTTNGLVKVTTKNIALEVDYNVVKKEHEEATHKVEIMQ